MAYMNQERKAKIVAAAKPILAKYGIKATFRCRQHAIYCTLRSGSVNFFDDMIGHENLKSFAKDLGYFEINQYHYENNYTGTARAFLDEFLPTMGAADWYDNSDAMVDYFDTAYYWHVKVGEWKQPYQLTAQEATV